MQAFFSVPRVRAACGVMLLVLSAACDTNLVIPGIVRPGANRPPVITNASASVSASNLIELRAFVFDPESDGLTIDYVQLAGPFAVQQTRVTVGGAFSAKLRPSAPGACVFRIRASDGAFVTSADVSVDVPAPAVGGNPSIDGPAARPLPVGAFRVQFSGQVLSDAGLAPFALSGTVTIAPPPAGYQGGNPVVVTLQTDASPFVTASPPGALLLASSAPIGSVVEDAFAPGGGGPRIILSFSNASGPADDVFTVLLSSRDVTLTGPIDDRGLVAGSPARFRTAEANNGPFGIAAASIRLQPLGDAITGEIRLSSRTALPGDLLRSPDYWAQITGTR